MSDEKKSSSSSTVSFRLIPFTGAFFAIWAFFSPEKYGEWMGTIVHSFLQAAKLK